MIIGSAISICCVCLCILLGFGVWWEAMINTLPFELQGELLAIEGMDYTAPDELNNETNTGQTERNQYDQQNENNENRFVINEADGIMTADMDVQFSYYTDLGTDELASAYSDFEQMIGLSYKDFAIKIPKIFVSKAFYSVDAPSGVAKKEYTPHDYVFEYQTKNGGEVTIAICALEEPLRDCFIVCDKPEQSEINGLAVIIYGYEDKFMVQFSCDHVNYDIETNNITRKELEELLTGMILTYY